MFRKIKKDIASNKSMYILFSILFAVNLVLFKFILEENRKLSGNIFYYILVLLCCVLEIIYFIILKKVDFNKVKIEKLFLIIMIPIGLLYLIAFPLGKTPDEQTHFSRAYEISEGYLISDKNKDGVGGRKFSTTLIRAMYPGNYSEVIDTLNQDKSKKTVFMNFSNTALYSFVCYLPQALGIFVSGLFGASYAISGYTGRLFNFLTFIFLTYNAIKLLPFKKISLLFLVLMPMMMQEAINLSPDALTLSCSFLLLSYVLNLRYTDKILKRKDKIIISLLTIVLSLCKIVYIPLCLLVFLIPKDKYKSKKDKYLYSFLTVGLAIIINLFWLSIASSYLIEFNKGVDSKEQVLFILNHILQYILIIFRTINQNFENYLTGFVGKNLGWYDINIALPYIYSTYAFIIYVFIKDVVSKKIDITTRLLGTFILICCVGLIFTSLYVQWTSVGSFVIEGVQGRYFLPLALLLFITCGKIDLRSKKEIVRDIKTYNYIFLVMVFINIYTIYVIGCHYC